MTTTAAALALSGRAELLAGFVSSLFASCDENAEARAKILSTIGRVDALRLARSQDEFEAAFDLLASTRFFLEFDRLVSDENVLALLRKEEACELAGHAAVVKDLRAAEFGEDLAERYSLFLGLLKKADPSGKPTREVFEALAAWAAAEVGVLLAAYAPDQWAEWMPGMLWNFGRRALVDVARVAGVGWAEAIDGLTTSRDQRLAAQPFDESASDEAATLLGLQ